jgi:hypothetical protein
MAFIGLLSDTHGIFDHKLENFFKDVDEIWHAGDFGNVAVSDKISSLKPLKGVYGNCDDQEIRRIHPYIQSFELEGMKFLIMHIGGYSGYYHNNAIKLISSHLPDVFICGHSHILKIMNDKKNNLISINPGAAGIQGFHEVRTAVRFKVEKGALLEMEVGEWSKRL